MSIVGEGFGTISIIAATHRLGEDQGRCSPVLSMSSHTDWIACTTKFGEYKEGANPLVVDSRGVSVVRVKNFTVAKTGIDVIDKSEKQLAVD